MGNDHVIGVIIEQHAEEASFLWLRRNLSVFAPNYQLSSLLHLDELIEANLDGLRIAGDAVWLTCQEFLNIEEAGNLFAAAFIAFEKNSQDRIQTLLELSTVSAPLSPGAISALGWLDYELAKPHIEQLALSQSCALSRIGIAAAAIHRKDPGQPLVHALTTDDPLLRTRALKAAGELGRADLLPQLLEHLESDDEKCRFYAAWSAALLGGEVKAVDVLKEFAVSNSTYREKAIQVALRRMILPAANHWREELAGSEETMRQAIIGAGIIGDPIAIPWLIGKMQVPALARIAGESFTMITGLDLAAENLDGEKPEGFESVPNDDPEDENVEMDPDEFLPWPKLDGIHHWWRNNQARFQPGTRYLVGQPIQGAWLQVVLRRGYQRQRAAAALELTKRQPGQPLFEVRAPGFRQKQLLSE